MIRFLIKAGRQRGRLRMPRTRVLLNDRRVYGLRQGWLATVFVASLWLGGCGQSDSSSRFIPSPSAAQSALESGMEAWKNGEPVGPVAGTKPVVHVVDSHRKPGQSLVSYEILGEVPGNAPRCFAVKAKLVDPEAEERLRYIVVGIDPLWIFSQEDYDLLTHWEHPMEERKSSKKSPKDQPPKL